MYASLLRTSRLRKGEVLSLTSTTQKPVTKELDVEILPGYQPCLISRAVEMRMQYYSRTVGLGAFFEIFLSRTVGFRQSPPLTR